MGPEGGAPVDERHTVRIGADGALVRAVSAVGAYRGLATLRQVLAAAPREVDGDRQLAGVEIVDGPRVSWRSLLLDVARCCWGAKLPKAASRTASRSAQWSASSGRRSHRARRPSTTSDRTFITVMGSA